MEYQEKQGSTEYSRSRWVAGFNSKRVVPSIIAALALACTFHNAHAQSKTFPAGTVVDVTQAPYNVVVNDGLDDTVKIQQAITANITANRTIYFPSGTYNLSDSLLWKRADGQWASQLTLQGQNRADTIFKLSDNATGFNSPTAPKAVIVTASPGSGGVGGGNTAFNNMIFDLTVNTGSGNSGAEGIELQCSNQGGIRNVTVTSGDGQGYAGIASLRGGNGPFLVKDVAVSGFQYGINTIANGSVYENVTLQGQSVAGVRSTTGCVVTIRNLNSTNTVPALSGAYAPYGRPSFTLLDSNLSGGSSANQAINVDGNLLLRNVMTSGYASNALKCRSTFVAGPNYTEYVSSPVSKLWTDSATKTLGLPIQETPDYWNTNLTDWAVVTATGGDDTVALQTAIDSGKPVVCLKGGVYRLASTLHVRGNVRQIIGMGAILENYGGYFSDAANPHPLLSIETAGTVSIERVRVGGYPDGGIGIEHTTSGTLILRNVHMRVGATVYRNTTQGASVFLEDVSDEIHHNNVWQFSGQDVWARQFNVEAYDYVIDPAIAQVTNTGGRLWMLGYKTEGVGPYSRTSNGGKTELMGGYHLWTKPSATEGNLTANSVEHIVDNAYGSFNFIDDSYVSGQTYNTYLNQATETRGTDTRTLLTSSIYWRDNSQPVTGGTGTGNNGHIVPLFCAYPGPSTGSGTGLKGQYYGTNNLTTLVQTQTDPTVNFDWAAGQPKKLDGTTMTSVGPDGFSIRWTGQVQAVETGTYTFSTYTDNGIRLWLGTGTTPLIDDWSNTAPLNHSTTYFLVAGEKIDLKMEYFENGGGAAAKLSWLRPGQTTSQIIPQAQLYPAP